MCGVCTPGVTHTTSGGCEKSDVKEAICSFFVFISLSIIDIERDSVSWYCMWMSLDRDPVYLSTYYVSDLGDLSVQAASIQGDPLRKKKENPQSEGSIQRRNSSISRAFFKK